MEDRSEPRLFFPSYSDLSLSSLSFSFSRRRRAQEIFFVLIIVIVLSMNPPIFDHERLRAYQEALRFVVWVGPIIEKLPAKLAAKDQLDRASTSIVLNIAEGNGKRSHPDRCRYLDISRGSALVFHRAGTRPAAAPWSGADVHGASARWW